MLVQKWKGVGYLFLVGGEGKEWCERWAKRTKRVILLVGNIKNINFFWCFDGMPKRNGNSIPNNWHFIEFFASKWKTKTWHQMKECLRLSALRIELSNRPEKRCRFQWPPVLRLCSSTHSLIVSYKLYIYFRPQESELKIWTVLGLIYKTLVEISLKAMSRHRLIGSQTWPDRVVACHRDVSPSSLALYAEETINFSTLLPDSHHLPNVRKYLYI